MTTKYLTGAYPNGYTVANNVTVLDIEATASIGGSGLSGLGAGYSVQIINDGAVLAASGNGYGITIFQTGADITNGMSNHAALIEGSKTGIDATNTTVTNFGTIEGLGASYGYAGVELHSNSIARDAPTVANGSAADTGALIKGYAGIDGVFSTVSNFGSIVGTGGAGVSALIHQVSYGVTVTNGSKVDLAAYIYGKGAGVYVRYVIATVTNFGTISTHGFEAVALLSGGLVDNFGAISATGASGAGIELSGGVSVFNGSAQGAAASVTGVSVGITSSGKLSSTIVNYGTVSATALSGYGIVLKTGGHIRNGSSQDITALIEGAGGGVSLQSNQATIVNNGTITGGSLGGVRMSAMHDNLINGSSTNASALIAGGGASVVSGTADTVINFGTISGLSLTSASDVLKVEAGCVFETPVQDAGTLSLVNGVGTLSNLTGDAVVVSGSMAATTFSGFRTLGIGKAARFTLAGPGTIGVGQTLADGGVLAVTDGLVVSGAVTGTGVIGLAAHATAEFDTAAPKALTVAFQDSGSVLALKDPSAFAATIGGFNRRGKIDLLGITATSAVLGAGDKLMITNGSTAVATLQLAGSFTGDTFATSSDGSGGTYVTVSRAGAAVAVEPPPRVGAPPPMPFIAAMAGLGASGGAVFHASGAWPAREVMLATPAR